MSSNKININDLKTEGAEDGQTLRWLDGCAQWADSAGAPILFSFGGLSDGFLGGGKCGTTTLNVIDKFPFASHVGVAYAGVAMSYLDTGRIWLSRGVSDTDNCNGYMVGGNPTINWVQKFSYNTEGNATCVGTLSGCATVEGVQTQATRGYGYSSGGFPGPPGQRTIGFIQKFPFAVDENATCIGSLALSSAAGSGNSSSTHGYAAGGDFDIGDFHSWIQKFPFATEENAVCIGNLTVSCENWSSQSSTTAGYASGVSYGAPSSSSLINKFSFANDENATCIGDLTFSPSPSYCLIAAGISSTVGGYAALGSIDCFPFASDTNATCVGNVNKPRCGSSGHQG